MEVWLAGQSMVSNHVQAYETITLVPREANQRPDGLYSSALSFCEVDLNVLLKSRPLSEGMNSEWSGVEYS